MVLLKTVSSAQTQLAAQLRQQRVNKGFTQSGLAIRAGIALPTLRKFEQKGLISLESFLKICMALGVLDNIVKSTSPAITQFLTIDDVLKANQKSVRKKGWRT